MVQSLYLIALKAIADYFEHCSPSQRADFLVQGLVQLNRKERNSELTMAITNLIGIVNRME